MGKHDHAPACKHAKLAYCDHCKVVYCQECGKEWQDQAPKLVFHEPKPTWIPPQPFGGGNSWRQPDFRPGEVLCQHEFHGADTD